jgi:hypothetical protein
MWATRHVAEFYRGDTRRGCLTGRTSRAGMMKGHVQVITCVVGAGR